MTSTFHEENFDPLHSTLREALGLGFRLTPLQLYLEDDHRDQVSLVVLAVSEHYSSVRSRSSLTLQGDIFTLYRLFESSHGLLWNYVSGFCLLK